MITKARMVGYLATAALAAGAVLAPQAEAQPEVHGAAVKAESYGNCSYFAKTQYGVTCDVWAGDHTVRLTMRYNYPPNANRVTAYGGWLDGTNDYSGRTWNGPLGTSANRYTYHLWRACGYYWLTGYTCTPWLN